MTSKNSQRNQLSTLIHPFIFVLKEGNGFTKNYMDYSLMMVFVHPQYLKSEEKKLPRVPQGVHVHHPINRIGQAPSTATAS